MTKKQNLHATILLIVEYNIILSLDYWTLSPTKYILLTLIGTLLLSFNYLMFTRIADEEET